MKYYVVGYTDLSKTLQLYDPHKRRLFTSRDVVFPDSTKCLDSTRLETLDDLPFDLDNKEPWTIEQKWYFREWIAKNLDDAIDWAKNGNPTLSKFIRSRPHEDNPNIGLSNKDQDLLAKLNQNLDSISK
jgi:hypothetical protein